ncbi:MAG: electron transfer flavoprotein subunit beta/FixA family protein [Pseudopedobacter sp.]|nr:electron transfer flavoprotein subunit beta/FixA family protein [Deinococcales bacterium]
MKILCLIRQVPDAEARLKTQDGNMDLSSATLVMDSMDEYGLEEALRLRERGLEAEIIALGIGAREDALRSSLAMGADRAIFVETQENLDPIALSSVVESIARAEDVSLILVGGQQADWDSQALGAAVAARLDWPALTWVVELALEGQTLKGRHDTDEGNESFEVNLPAVITTQQGLNEPRYITLPNIMKAKKKELRRDSLEDYGATAKVRRLNSEIQPRMRLNKIIDGKDPQAAVAQLLELLRTEAQVAV